MKFVFLTFLLIIFSSIYSENCVFAQLNEIQVKIINAEELNGIIKNNDRPLLINVWATWCMPCREEFPDLVRISNASILKFIF